MRSVASRRLTVIATVIDPARAARDAAQSLFGGIRIERDFVVAPLKHVAVHVMQTQPLSIWSGYTCQ